MKRIWLGLVLLLLPVMVQAQTTTTEATAPVAVETTGAATTPAPDAAASKCVAPKVDIAVAPTVNGQPVEVSLGFFFTDILGVSDPDQNVEADIAQVMEWTDPRLASLAGCYLPFPDVWSPRLELLNSSRLAPKYTQARNQVEVLEGGRLRYVQRYSGTISTYHDLSHFPFDHHVFKFRLISPLNDASTVQIVPNLDLTGVSEKLNVEDWSFASVDAHSENAAVAGFQGERSVLTVDLQAQRHVLYYIYKVLVPLGLIVSMSWVVFWISPSNFEAQIGFGATSMLTLIAFQFSMVNAVPKLNYFSSMDYLVFGGTILVYSAILEALITGLLFRRGLEHRATQMDKICRWLYPTIFVVYWVVVISMGYFSERGGV